MIAATSPLEAARRARYLRSFANRPDATPSQRRERWAESETWQAMAVCGSGSWVPDHHTFTEARDA